MTAAHNPSEERLLAYVAGTLSPPEAVVVATHLALRPASARWASRLQDIGGALLEEAPPADLSEGALARALARIDVDGGEVVSPPVANDMTDLPEPLRRYALGPWRWAGPGVRVREVHAPRDGDCRVILLEIGPGRKTPKHTHRGVELTCVIKGAYATETEAFGVGDFEEADEATLHQPRVTSEGPCLCVAALDGEIQLDGWVGRLLQPFVRL